jgi:hypothetical protein
VLVVDGVELVLLDELLQVRELDGDNTLGPEQRGDASDEAVQVGHLGQDVVADDQVGHGPLADELRCELGAEELREGGDALLLGHLRHVEGRLDAEDGDALRDEPLEQVAVVAGQLDGQAVGRELQPLGDPLDVVATVGEPRVRVRREVRVLGEDVLGSDVLLELHQEALLADVDPQGIERLHGVDPAGLDVALAQRRHAQVDEGVSQVRTAEAARPAGGAVTSSLGFARGRVEAAARCAGTRRN